MDKVRLGLIILTIAIIVGPIVGVVYVYRDNLVGLVVPPELTRVADGNFSESEFEPPMLVGEPTYDPVTRTSTLSFKFTNPLQTTISFENISANVICKDHGEFLGNVLMNQPTTIAPNEEVILDASGIWADNAINHFKIYHSGSEDKDISVAVENLNVSVGGVQIQIDELGDAGLLSIPTEMIK